MTKPKLTTFKNGLRLLVIPQPAAATATALVLVGTGSKYESRSENGLSHFLEHMCFKGTAHLPTPKDVVESFDRLGAISNAFTSTEYTGYYAKGGPDNIPTFLSILGDIYLNSTFPEAEIEKEKGVIIEEINMYEDMPQQKVGEALTALLYGDQPAGWPIIGTKENVKSFTRNDFISYKAKHYHAENTVIVVCGAVTPADIRPLVVQAFGHMSSAKITTKKKVRVTKGNLGLVVVEKKSDQAHIAIGFHSIPFGHPDMAAVNLLATILGRGMSSRLFLALRDEMGAAYYVGAGQESHTDHGIFEISAGIDKTRVNEIFGRIASILKEIKEKTVSIEELSKAREYSLGMQRLGLESSDEVAGFYGIQLIMHGMVKTPAQIIAEYRAVTPADIRRVARKLCIPGNMGIAVIGPFARAAIDTTPFSSL